MYLNVVLFSVHEGGLESMPRVGVCVSVVLVHKFRNVCVVLFDWSCNLCDAAMGRYMLYNIIAFFDHWCIGALVLWLFIGAMSGAHAARC